MTMPIFAPQRVATTSLCLLLGAACTPGEDGSLDGETGTETGSSESETGDPSACETIELEGEGFFPESLAVDDQGRLHVSSTGMGMVARITPCETIETLIAPGTELRNPTGVALDLARERLLVCDSDVSFQTTASLDVFELESGELVASHDFEPMSVCNDIVIAPSGEVYATDSTMARVVRIAADALDTDSPVETWASDPSFVASPGAFGLDGIAHDGDAALYLSNFELGLIHRITIDDEGNPGAIESLGLERELAMPDGIRWRAGQLLITEVGLGDIVALDPATGTLEVLAEGLDTPSSLALLDDHAWVTQAQLDHLLGLDPSPPALPFSLVRVELP